MQPLPISNATGTRNGEETGSPQTPLLWQEPTPIKCLQALNASFTSLGGASQGKQAARVVGSSHRNTEPDSKEHASDLSGTTQRAGTPQPLPPSFLGPEWASPCGGCHLTATPRDCPSKAQAKDPTPRGSNSPQIVAPFCARPDLLHTRAHTPGGGGTSPHRPLPQPSPSPK